jgi:hypothetical protein
MAKADKKVTRNKVEEESHDRNEATMGKNREGKEKRMGEEERQKGIMGEGKGKRNEWGKKGKKD